LHARAALVPAAAGTPPFPEPSEPALALGAAAVVQYLIPGDGGRLQAHPTAWDPVAEEWFDVFPEEPAPADWAHWTQPGATANTQCLECHVTGYAKGYDPTTDTYDTRWAELGVGCEACHGPGQAHVTHHTGAGVDAPDPYGVTTAALQRLEPCMPCHALRTVIADGYQPGYPLADHFDLELLDTRALHSDGQIAGEAYEWTSFQMSRMAGAGVRCQDCHEPHSGMLRDTGSALCLRCHEPELASAEHVRHPPDSPGAACVGCHMPVHVFMERDQRRDHAFTRPDPRRSRAIGAPDACLVCHTDRTADWSAEKVAAWYGAEPAARQAQRALAVLLAAGLGGEGDVAPPLARLLDTTLDPIRRASAARGLAAMMDEPGVVEALGRAAQDADPFVRAAAVRALGERASDPAVTSTLVAATRDPRRLVRIEAGFALASVSVTGLADGDASAVASSQNEWHAAQAILAELPETHFNQGLFFAAAGDVPQAAAAYRAAIRLWPADLSPRQNLAMLLRGSGQEEAAARELRAIVTRDPRWPTAAYQLAQSERALGNEAAVVTALEMATDDPVSRRRALRELIRIASERDDRALAGRWLREALLADPATAGDPAVQRALAIPE
jgi:predicted CXXCH cytochrome family protein